MHNRPSTEELLLIARHSLMSKLLPALAEPLRYEARMIAKAMAIAHRELTEAPPGVPLEMLLQRALHENRPQHARPMEGAEAPTTAELLRLVMRIRAGEFDLPGEAQRALLAFLREYTRSRVAITNPKLLEGETHVQA